MSANLMSLARSGGKFLKLFGDRKMMKILPYDTEVEYLESTGTQWIDTGIKRNIDDEFFVDFQFPNLTQSQIHSTVYGYEIESTNRLIFRKFVNFGFYGFTPTGFLEISNFDTARHQCLAQPGTGYVFDGIVKSNAYKNNSANINMFLFACAISETEANAFGEVRIFAYYQKRNGNKIIDLIPVLDREMRPAMYDRVTGKLFYNKGTGEFIVGPDKTI